MEAQPSSVQARWALQAAVPAVVAGYPLLEALQTCRRQAMSAQPGHGRAPFNHIAHSTRTWTDRDRDFNTPTVDLLYSNAWIDLRAGPVLLDIPPRSRFFVVELLDAWTHNFLNLGTRNVPAEGARYALLAPGMDDAAAPAGTLPVRCPTALVWLLGRVIVDGEADLPAARKVQENFRLAGAAGHAPFASLAQWQDTGDTALDFYANLSRALADFPPLAGQGAPFELVDFSRMRGSALEGLRLAHREGLALIEGHTHAASKAPWRFSTRLGRFGRDYMLRAATAMKGIGALAADEAIYAPADYDQQGELLDGSRSYRIRFDDGGDLPADAFWSITLYGEDRFLAPSPNGRHALGSRSGMVKEADGSLVLHVAHVKPADAPESNWLPAPEGVFYLILRMYHPQRRLLEGKYAFPPVERV
ncbi:DUF1254 domain-containing protein [Ramlibacter sp. G-1-2-2]|uniref:DUF1254 domain-containing protein n=1 Tax=Ramlibacter agri TaxID=2728837 RepID=A0A848HDT6_9BURK|nr:DUF1254 domain-containing protein [Ramlibacter agri]NML47639.1 DUF1254 domain-containing protein [Ramlibacter agri]